MFHVHGHATAEHRIKWERGNGINLSMDMSHITVLLEHIYYLEGTLTCSTLTYVSMVFILLCILWLCDFIRFNVSVFELFPQMY